MTNLDKARYAYQHDDRYHALVDMLRHEIEDLNLSPAEVREIAMFACVLVEAPRTPMLFATTSNVCLNPTEWTRRPK